MSTTIFEAALAGNFNDVIHLYSRGRDVNMAIMGATPRNPPNDGKDEERKIIAAWAFENGACLLWGMNQERKRED